MNKEQLRKELEDCWDASFRHYIQGSIIRKEPYIDSRLAALDDGDYKAVANAVGAFDESLNDSVDDGNRPQEEIIEVFEQEAEIRYPVKTHMEPENSPYKNSKVTFLHGCKFWYKICAESSSIPLDDGQEGKGLMNDPFIQKHLKKIADLSADGYIVTIIEKMWGGLEMASVEHFMQTGKVNGGFHLRLKELMYHFAERWHNTIALPVADGEGEKGVDLVKLQERSDKLLAEETEESFNEWLKSKGYDAEMNKIDEEGEKVGDMADALIYVVTEANDNGDEYKVIRGKVIKTLVDKWDVPIEPLLPSAVTGERLQAATRKRDLLFDVLSSYDRRIEIRAAALAFIKAYDELLEVAP